MSLVYVFAASKMEGQPVQQVGSASPESSTTPRAEPLRSGANEVVLVVGGMGPKKAQAKATETLAIASHPSPSIPSGRRPDAILIIGLCGGLTSSLSENKIVAYTDCLSTEPDKPLLQCSATVTNKVIEFLQSHGISCERVVGITSPRIAVTKDDKVALAKRGANAVDMESYEIIAVAGQAGIPAVALRVVSDTPDTNMPDFNRALNRDGMLDGRKALRVALASPIRTARLLSANKRAMSHLAKALEIILPADCFPKGQL
ncbi:MAG: hypothetical protein EPN47_17375 [Acidobacteria bacterium]|jgi:nucleoside phosphorylase|nr:MAG: hypothetical protein EPN47_17375 [Acidobacteriota bacterium]